MQTVKQVSAVEAARTAAHKAEVQAKKAAAWAALVEVVQAAPATRQTKTVYRRGACLVTEYVQGTATYTEVIDGEEFRAHIRAVPGVGQVVTFMNKAATHGRVSDIRTMAKVRHFLLVQSADKGFEGWLFQAGEGKFFPHSVSTGKYRRAATHVLASLFVGR